MEIGKGLILDRYTCRSMQRLSSLDLSKNQQPERSLMEVDFAIYQPNQFFVYLMDEYQCVSIEHKANCEQIECTAILLIVCYPALF